MPNRRRPLPRRIIRSFGFPQDCRSGCNAIDFRGPLQRREAGPSDPITQPAAHTIPNPPEKSIPSPLQGLPYVEIGPIEGVLCPAYQPVRRPLRRHQRAGRPQARSRGSRMPREETLPGGPPAEYPTDRVTLCRSSIVAATTHGTTQGQERKACDAVVRDRVGGQFPDLFGREGYHTLVHAPLQGRGSLTTCIAHRRFGCRPDRLTENLGRTGRLDLNVGTLVRGANNDYTFSGFAGRWL